MLTRELKYQDPKTKKLTELENWMKFAHFLGWHMKEQEEKLKIYVSVPSSLLFSYFITLGAIDFGFNQILRSENLMKNFLRLKPGSKVLYRLDNNEWKKCTVLGVGDHPKAPGKKAIKIMDHKKSALYVPEQRWLTNLRIFDEEAGDVKNARTISNVANMAEDPILSKFYSKESLSAADLRNSPEVLISTIKKEWLDNLALIKLVAKGCHFKLNNFIFFDEKGSNFNNIEFSSEKILLNKERLDSSIGLFIGAGRCMRKLNEFNQAKSIYLVDRYESVDKLKDLQFHIEQNFLVNGSVSVNETLLKRIEDAEISLPKGVELFAWK